MRVYKRVRRAYKYPTEVGIILNYLNENGEVFCLEYMIEELYEQFSQEKHNCSWMHVILTAPRDIMLPEFAKWLEHIDI